jgi:aminomethyltransferase
MGQAFLAAADHDTVATALESLIPADILNLGRGRQRYSQFLSAEGGVLDDLMVVRSPDPSDDGVLGLVVNASRKAADFALLQDRLAGRAQLTIGEDRALLALQGPQAAAVMADLCPEAAGLSFMGAASGSVAGIEAGFTRSGYTGEDGYEISVKADNVVALWRKLLADPRVKPIGLGARDSLRLEAGLCLYGHELDETTSPVEADLTWSIQKRRRLEGGFPGAERLQREWAKGPDRVRVGLIPEGRSPVREGAVIRDTAGTPVGIVTSGGFGPTVAGPIAMGYLPPALARPGSTALVDLRGKDVTVRVAALPFTPHRYHRS